MRPDYEPIDSLVSQSINDQLYSEYKALAGGVPFPGSGGMGGMVPVYSSWDSWDAAMDRRYGDSSSSVMNYASKVGDLAQSSLLVAAIRWFGNVLPQAKLQVKKSTGKKGASEPIPDHGLVKLWKRPNQYYSGSTLLKAIAFSWILRSEAYILKFYNNAGTEPYELWYEPHWTIRPVWPMDGSEFIAYYEVNRDGRWIQVPAENVIHLRDGLNPYNPRIGFSGIPSILRELYGDQEAAAYYATLMGGSAVPPFLVGLDANMNMGQKEIDAFTSDLIRKTTGIRKGQPIVAKGAKAYKLGFSPRELDLREARYMPEDRFCAVMGIPAVVLELGSGQAHSIYNNVKQAEGRAWTSYVTPFLNHLQDELTVQLLSDWEDIEDNTIYCEHDLSKVQALQEDEDAKAERLGGLYKDGVIQRCEARSGLSYGPSVEDDEEVDKVWAVLSANEKQVVDEQKAEKQAEIAAAQAKEASKLMGGKPVVGQLPGKVGAKKPLLAVVKSLLPTPFQMSSVAVTTNGKENWVDFPLNFGSLNIPRVSMPQVKSEHRGAMVQFLKGRGITSKKETILPTLLKPSQKEYRPDKVESAKNWTGTQRPLLVSIEGYVVDGHHQWMSAVTHHPEVVIPIIRLNSPVLPLLLEVARFPSSGVKDENDKEKFWSKALDSEGVDESQLTNEDIQETIDWLKQYRFENAAAMLTAEAVEVT